MFIGLLSGVVVSASNYTKCMLLSNQKCMTYPTLINSNPNESSKEFQYYPFVGSFNSLNYYLI